MTVLIAIVLAFAAGAFLCFLLMKGFIGHDKRVARKMMEQAKNTEREASRHIEALGELMIQGYRLAAEADAILGSKTRFENKVNSWQRQAHDYRRRMNILFENARVPLE